MTDLPTFYDENLKELIDKATDLPLESDAATKAMVNLEKFSNLHARLPQLQKQTPPAPTSHKEPTRWDRVKAGMSCVYDNETTRAIIKAGGALGGVAIVAYSTIKKDHVMERQALAQANQPPPR